MKIFKLVLTLATIMVAISMSSCSKNSTILDEPIIEVPSVDEKSDTVSIKITPNVELLESPFETRSGNSRDLIGVEISRKIASSESNAGAPTTVVYSSGVFDNIDNIVFKFVKGGSYSIRMCYYPNAKDIVYNYPDGTFGSPFSYIYGLQAYNLNEPVYYSGVAGGWSGDQGPILPWLLDDIYQPTADRLVQSFYRGDTPRYSGTTDYFTVDENTTITIKLELCMMSITLQPDNFTEGELSLCFRNYMYMDAERATWVVKPGDEMTKRMQIPYIAGEESLEMFYTNGKGEKFLLATKQLQRKLCTNFVFKFTLTERADGSIGIQMPSDENFGTENSYFEY